VRPWDSLSEDERRLFARMAENYAGFVSYTDQQIGRLLDYLEESGQLQDTIIIVTSDNGASGEGGPNGSFNENKFFNNVPDTVEANLARIDELGGPNSYPHYTTGWAWAFDTPFPYWKRFAGYEGGVADPLLVAWPGHIPSGGEVRHKYLHAVDIVPTIYDLLGVDPPAVLKGWTQSPIEGRSFAATFNDPQAPGRQTQFYSMLGMRGLYYQGWLANTAHPPLSGWGSFDKDVWELYDLRADRTQTHNLAAEHPQLLEQLKGLWFYYAGIYKGLPLDDRTPLEILTSWRPEPSEPRERYVYYPAPPRSPSRSRSTSAAAPTLSPPASASTPPRPRGCCSPTAGSAAATACSSATAASTTSTTGSASAPRPSPPSRPSWPAGMCSPPSSPRPARTPRPTAPSGP
jgi:arylsulfatase